jgi:tRNA threonylcarbamoyladenosine biosynthesis protein TsaB
MILGIETATSVCSVGLVRDGGLLAETSEDAGRRHSIVLVDMIEHVLNEVGASKREFKGVAVSAGPGSFTGLRIGMALAKGICLATGIPLLVVSTLEALALQSGSTASVICACLDARHDELYSGVYLGSGISREVVHPDASRSVNELAGLLEAGAVVAGFGISDYAEALERRGHSVLPDIGPSGGAVASLGERQLKSGVLSPLDLAEPNYCKKSQPERLQAEKRQ